MVVSKYHNYDAKPRSHVMADGCFRVEEGDEMDRGSNIQEYSAGDSVRIRLQVEHEFDFSTLEAGFEHKDFDPTIEGRGEETHAVTLVGQNPEQLVRLETVPANITSFVMLEGNLTAEKVLGEYRCGRMVAHYKGGRQIPFDLGRSPEMRFRVVEEPVGSPKVTSVEFLEAHGDPGHS